MSGAARRAAAAGRAVTIAGRVFTLGAVYTSAIPPPKPTDPPRVPRRLVSFDPAFDWPGGRVEVELLEARVRGRKPRRLRISGEAWAKWAAEAVEG